MTELNQNRDLIKYEKYIFLLFILIHLLPLLFVKYFVTLDGPAHLYNANLIKNYFTGEADFIKQYFYLNPNPEPNWTGHFLISLFLTFLPAYLAEKMLMILYVILLPVSFRMLTRQINPASAWGSYLIFPFIYNMPFCFGFFNFSLSLPVLLFGICFWMRAETFTIKSGLLFILLVILAYFSHLFSCLALVAVSAALLSGQTWREKGKAVEKLKALKSKWLALLIIGIPLLVIVLNAIHTNGISGFQGKISSLPTIELLSYASVTRTLICWDYEAENIAAACMSVLFVLMILAVIYFRATEKQKALTKTDSWFLFSLGALLLFFIVPDSIASGGFISIRLLLYFHLLFIIWIAVQSLNNYVVIIFSTCAMLISLWLINIRMDISAGLNKDAKELMEINEKIPDRNNLFPLIYSNNWLHLNLSNYAGADKNVVVLDNYEPCYPQFPLRWQPGAFPYKLIGNFATSRRPCIQFDAYEKTSGLEINYVLRWAYDPSMNDSCTLITAQLLNDQFDLVFTSSGKRAELFKRKNK